eukprot:CAMPEP_0175824838 /NCGR_PEP_ID=MMETSP0107_2-20121207/10932_1 /TAXON_ID=195067 ORGANISM="Goniomonas pacifica, Strain CCMP1869" /NCGR_SAMPLE_ID=MMETSP0107_2 /ASSEMBLY_ACC=CAM_ASM_000203 /LENGTH=57 /DNA_ID=CAMNT_0017137411 /DNA_START=535 /DNA_END=708 /DNA_ORIENTATION=-
MTPAPTTGGGLPFICDSSPYDWVVGEALLGSSSSAIELAAAEGNQRLSLSSSGTELA